MNAESNEQIINEICDYSVRYEVKVMKRKVLTQKHVLALPLFSCPRVLYFLFLAATNCLAYRCIFLTSLVCSFISILMYVLYTKELLGTYMKRLIVNKPEEPLKYLLKTIQEDPYIVANATPMAPPAPTAEEEAAASTSVTPASAAEATA